LYHASTCGNCCQEIIEDYYPDLAVEDIQACLEYAIETTPGEILAL
jgi:uncharacterized protein (DUF433 family)